VDFFTPSNELLLKRVCASSGFSLKWFTGDPRGAVQAAEQDAISDLSNLRRLFGDFKEPIKKFVEAYYPEAKGKIDEVTPLILHLADEAEQKELEDGETPDEETKKDSKEKPKDE
jgi:hypothetical protein